MPAEYFLINTHQLLSLALIEPKELQDLLSKFVVDPVCTPQEDIYFLHKSGQNVIGEMEKPVAESLFVKPSAQPKKYFEAK